MLSDRSTSPSQRERRSPCPIACGLDVFGDRWTLLVVRDLLLGRTRFKDFTASPEGIPTNILADRLERLCAQKIVERARGANGSGHPRYRLTRKGLALRLVLESMKAWALRWEKGTRATME